jgi:hypothetical protein
MLTSQASCRLFELQIRHKQPVMDPPTSPPSHSPFRVPPVDVHEVPGLNAAATGELPPSGATERTALHGHGETFRVVHRLHRYAPRGAVQVVRPKRRPSRGLRPGDGSVTWAERADPTSRWGVHGAPLDAKLTTARSLEGLQCLV